MNEVADRSRENENVGWMGSISPFSDRINKFFFFGWKKLCLKIKIELKR